VRKAALSEARATITCDTKDDTRSREVLCAAACSASQYVFIAHHASVQPRMAAEERTGYSALVPRIASSFAVSMTIAEITGEIPCLSSLLHRRMTHVCEDRFCDFSRT
jgi:hypothetical protein